MEDYLLSPHQRERTFGASPLVTATVSFTVSCTGGVRCGRYVGGAGIKQEVREGEMRLEVS
jgi:hypothetical protein